VHGWVYGLHNGLLQDMAVTAGSLDEVTPAYDHALRALHQRWRARHQALTSQA
jgi:carbonic anhydrase